MHVGQVSNLTAMIARDEYILEESFSGEEEAEEVEEETEGVGDKGELERLRERREVSTTWVKGSQNFTYLLFD